MADGRSPAGGGGGRTAPWRSKPCGQRGLGLGSSLGLSAWQVGSPAGLARRARQSPSFVLHAVKSAEFERVGARSFSDYQDGTLSRPNFMTHFYIEEAGSRTGRGPRSARRGASIARGVARDGARFKSRFLNASTHQWARALATPTWVRRGCPLFFSFHFMTSKGLADSLLMSTSAPSRPKVHDGDAGRVG